jgi:hypothetical protein
MKKKIACQTSINARPAHAPEGRQKDRAEIITTLYTITSKPVIATFAGSARV